MNKSLRWAAISAVAGALLAPAGAVAAAPTLNSVEQLNRTLIVDWTPSSNQPDQLKIARGDVVDANGLLVDTVTDAYLSPPSPYTTDFRLAPGTYHVQVFSCPGACDGNNVEVSSVKSITIRPDLWTPPRLTSVTPISAGGLDIKWATDGRFPADHLEVASSPVEDPDGHFQQQNVKIYQYLSTDATSYTTSIVLAPGPYWVKVASYDTFCVWLFDSGCYLWSNVVPVTIGAGGGGLPGVTGDKLTSFTSVKCASRQKAGKLVVKASMPENGTITVGGSLSVPNAAKAYKIKSVSVPAAAGQTVKVRVKLSKKALKAIKRAVKRHKKIKAKLRITATDVAGNTTTEKRSVRLR